MEKPPQCGGSWTKKLNGMVRASENGRGKKNSLHRFVLFEECESLVLKLRRSKPVRGPRHNLLAPELLDPRKAGRIDGGGATVDLDNIASAHRRATIIGYVARPLDIEAAE